MASLNGAWVQQTAHPATLATHAEKLKGHRMLPHRSPLSLSLLLLLAACSSSSPSTAPDATPDASAAADADPAPDADPDPAPDAAAPDAAAPDADPPTADACPGRYANVTTAGTLADAELREASGLASSRTSPDVLWSHNDSGDTARLFALTTDGGALGRLALAQVNAVDFEDIAAAPCPGNTGHCLYVADTGNNRRNRQDQTLYIVQEPTVSPNQPLSGVSAAPTHTLPLRFGGESIDAEALAVAPDASAIYIFEKINGPSFRVFAAQAPFIDGQTVELQPIATVPSPGININDGFGYAVTGADLHPSGRRVAIRLYVGSWEYRLAEGQTLADLGAIPPTPIAAGPLSEPQGEAIAYDAQGTGLWTVSELSDQEPPVELHHVGCR
jgi:hypothetical protein